MDLTNYKERKKNNHISLTKYGEKHAIKIKRYSPYTGELIAEEEYHVKMGDLVKKRDELQEQLKEADQLIKDLESLDKK